MNTKNESMPIYLLSTIRLLLLVGLSAQTLAVSFFFVVVTAACVLDVLTLDFSFFHTAPWSSYFGMASFLMGSIHLIARLIDRWPERYKKRPIDMLACIPCIAFPGWASISLILGNKMNLHNLLFYGLPTMFNIIVLCFATITALRRHSFDRTTPHC